MSADDDLEEIRRRKREQLRARVEGDGMVGDAGDGTVDDADATPSEPIRVEDGDHLQDVVSEHDVVLVDFYADWCGPCRMLEPTIGTIAAETAAVVAKVDVDAHQGLAAGQGVQGVPTLLLYVDGEPVERLVGAQSEAALRGLVEQHA